MKPVLCLPLVGLVTLIAVSCFGDFTKINPAGDLYISKVKHKTFIQVDEEGTEAAAVTSVVINQVSLPATFIIDRPFLFAIRERLSGTILFMGRVVDPTQ